MTPIHKKRCTAKIYLPGQHFHNPASIQMQPMKTFLVETVANQSETVANELETLETVANQVETVANQMETVANQLETVANQIQWKPLIFILKTGGFKTWLALKGGTFLLLDTSYRPRGHTRPLAFTTNRNKIKP